MKKRWNDSKKRREKLRKTSMKDRGREISLSSLSWSWGSTPRKDGRVCRHRWTWTLRCRCRGRASLWATPPRWWGTRTPRLVWDRSCQPCTPTCQLARKQVVRKQSRHKGKCVWNRWSKVIAAASPLTPFLNNCWMYFRPDTISLLTCRKQHASYPAQQFPKTKIAHCSCSHISTPPKVFNNKQKDWTPSPWSWSLFCIQLPPSAQTGSSWSFQGLLDRKEKVGV